jgi:hypothetical protein
MAVEHNFEAPERTDRLAPVAGTIFALYLVILTGGYFLGNLIF